MVVRLIVQTVLWLAVMGALLFVPAGTQRWTAAWVFLLEMGALGLALGFWLSAHDPGLLKERLGSLFQREQKAWDRVGMAILLATFAGWFILMALDAVRFGYSDVPLWLQIVGALSIAGAVYVCFLTFRENSFAAPVVKVQKARGHKVVTSGPYRVVRHPMYAGALLFFVGTPLLLGSWFGLAFAPVLTLLLAGRIVMEERTLTDELDGYREYSRQGPLSAHPARLVNPTIYVQLRIVPEDAVLVERDAPVCSRDMP